MPEDSEFLKQVRLTIDTATKLKARMKERGLTRAQSICPKCGNRLDGALLGPKSHLHMSCRTADCLMMME